MFLFVSCAVFGDCLQQVRDIYRDTLGFSFLFMLWIQLKTTVCLCFPNLEKPFQTAMAFSISRSPASVCVVCIFAHKCYAAVYRSPCMCVYVCMIVNLSEYVCVYLNY